MVRFLTGALVAVGTGRNETAWPGQVLASGTRPSQVQLAPAHGLTLEQVAYPATPQSQRAQSRRARTKRGDGPAVRTVGTHIAPG
jgi:tRNA pseudouridine38-40 synthase